MATLVSCLECHKTVSSEAPRCPHCTTRYPLGVKCIVCCQNLKRSEALKLTKEYGGAENKISIKFFHPSCHRQVNQIRLGKGRTSCPVCKCAIEFETASSVSCHQCGQRFATNFADPSFAFCYYCGFRLNTNLEIPIKEISRPFLEQWVTETLYAHKICYTSERKEEEQNLLREEQLLIQKVKKQRTIALNEQKAQQTREKISLALVYLLVLSLVVGGLGSVSLNWVLAWGFDWRSMALLGFLGVFVSTIIAFLIFSLFKRT